MVYLIVNTILRIVIAGYGTQHAIFYRRSDLLCCPRCGGHMKIISFITDPQLIRQILEYLAAGSESPRLGEASGYGSPEPRPAKRRSMKMPRVYEPR